MANSRERTAPAGPGGGKRAGAGRKSAATQDYQATMRGVVEQVVTAPRWRAAIEGMLVQIAEGNAKAFSALAPYVMGAAPKEIRVSGDGPLRLEVVYVDRPIDAEG